jgi:hypothetical protein
MINDHLEFLPRNPGASGPWYVTDSGELVNLGHFTIIRVMHAFDENGKPGYGVVGIIGPEEFPEIEGELDDPKDKSRWQEVFLRLPPSTITLDFFGFTAKGEPEIAARKSAMKALAHIQAFLGAARSFREGSLFQEDKRQEMTQSCC